MYKKDVIKLYKELAEKHNCNYKLAFNNRKTQLGNCNYETETISLSNIFIKNNDESLVRNTILHEIAHALTQSGHDMMWKIKCCRIGCKPNRLNAEATIPHKYVGTCPSCGKEIKRHKRSKTVACGTCCKKHNDNKWSEEFVFKYQEIIKNK